MASGGDLIYREDVSVKKQASGGNMRALILVLLLAIAPPAQADMAASRAASTAMASTADCFFNWAELAYPLYFAPIHQTSQSIDIYYFRYYSSTKAYLGATSNTQHAIYVGPVSGNSLIDLGSLAAWATQAGCSTTSPASVSHASGTYSWTPGSGVLVSSTSSSDFACKGPKVGTTTQNGVSVSASTMIWPDDGTVWSRSTGTAGDITGRWTVADSSTGNSYTLTFNGDLSFTLTGNIVQCVSNTNTTTANPLARAQHWPNGYFVRPSYDDANKTATAVSVSGPGINGTLSLAYSSYPGSNQGVWESWTLPGSPIALGTTPLALPYTYTFAITDASGTRTASSTVSCFQEQFATNLQPSGVIPGSPTFSWTGLQDANATYAVELNDSNGNRVWNTAQDSATTSVVYSGPALTPGMLYSYNVLVSNSSACSSQASFAAGSFIYQTQTAATSYAGQYTGYYYWNNNGSNGSGGWTMSISSSGAVTGQGAATCTGSCTNASNYPLSGSVAADGSIYFTTSGGDVCTGTISPSSGTIAGTCQYPFNKSTGSFAGTKQAAVQNVYLIPISLTGSSSNVTGAQVCVTVANQDTCATNGGFTVGQTYNIAVTGNANASYAVYLPSNQPAAAFCSVTSGGTGTLGANMPSAVVTCR